MISVLEYLDYRKFLKDFYLEKKKQLPFFSYRFFACKIGMDYSILIRMLQESLHVSNKKIGALALACDLNSEESQYFETLIRFNKAKTDRDGKMYFEKLLELQSFKQDVVVKNQYEFFSKWYYSALWTLLHQSPHKGPPSSLGKKLNPALTPKETKEALKLLESLGLVEKGFDGVIHATKTDLTTGPEWQSLTIREYQRAMIRLSEEALGRFPKNVRDISSVTINIPKNKLPEFSEYIREFRQSMIKLAASYPESDSLYQLNAQFFPLTSVKNL